MGADWPQFRGPGGQGVSSQTGLPTTWSDTENLLWKTALPGGGASSPIYLDGKLYLTCYTGYGQGQGGDISKLKRHLLCVDVKDGKVLWNTTVPPCPPEQSRVRDHGYAASTPATDGKHLYVFFGKCGVFKFDLAGKEVWQASVGSGTHNWGSGTSPVLCGDVVIVNASVESKSLVALNKQTGEEAWRAGGMSMSWNTPHLVDVKGRKEVVVSVKGRVLAFDPATGRKLWHCRGIPDYVCPSIVSKDGVVYVIGGRQSRALAIRAGGSGDVTASHKIWEARVGANVSSPVAYGEHLYWVSDRNRHAYCLKLADGSIVYDQPFPAPPYASMLAAGGKLYVVTRQGGTVVLEAGPKYKVLATNRLQDRSEFKASPIVADGKLILRSNRALYCIGARP